MDCGNSIISIYHKVEGMVNLCKESLEEFLIGLEIHKFSCVRASLFSGLRVESVMHCEFNTFQQIYGSYLRSSVGFSGCHRLYAAHNAPISCICNVNAVTLCQNKRNAKMIVEECRCSKAFLNHGNCLIEYFL